MISLTYSSLSILVVFALIPGDGSDVSVNIHPYNRSDLLSQEVDQDCFGGTTTHLDLEVSGVTGTLIDLVGQLFQLTDTLAATVSEPMVIAEAKRFDHTARFHVPVSLRIPAVKRRSRFAFRIRSRKMSDSKWQTAGHYIFEVYPNNLMYGIAAYAEKQTLFLVSNDSRLGSFFRGAEISFRELDEQELKALSIASQYDRTPAPQSSQRRPLILRVLSANSNTVDNGVPDPIDEGLLCKGFGIINFQEIVRTFPAVFVRQTISGVQVDVELPLIELLADSPRAQNLLTKIIEMAIMER